MKDTVFRGRGSLLCPARAKQKTDQVAIKDKQLSSAWMFNIPQDKHDPIILTNTARKDAALPTIKSLSRIPSLYTWLAPWPT